MAVAFLDDAINETRGVYSYGGKCLGYMACWSHVDPRRHIPESHGDISVCGELPAGPGSEHDQTGASSWGYSKIVATMMAPSVWRNVQDQCWRNSCQNSKSRYSGSGMPLGRWCVPGCVGGRLRRHYPPEMLMMLAAVTTRTRLGLQEQSVEHRKLPFSPTRVTRGLYRTLGELCVNELSSYPSSSNLQNKINLLCALNLTKWLLSTRCV
jgi:hypothetical protein